MLVQVGPEDHDTPPPEEYLVALERILTLEQDVHSIVPAAVHELVSVRRNEFPR